MPKINHRLATPTRALLCGLAAGIWIVASHPIAMHGQNAAASLETPAEPAAKAKARWTQALNKARRDLQNNNDRDSVAFVNAILESLDQPDGMSLAALAAGREKMTRQIHQLVAAGALDSAASLNTAQVMATYSDNFIPPEHPNHRTSGPPGPGGLVLYFPFDKPAENGVIHDESGAGNDGRVFGAQWVPEGKFGGAYRFSLTNFNDRIVVPNSDALNPEQITVAAWINVSGNNGFWRRIMDKDCWHGYALSLSGDENGKAPRGQPRFEGHANAGADRALDDGKWHHLAATFDGKSAACYVDGVGRSRPAHNGGPMKPTPWDLCIGNSVVGYSWQELMAFDGLIDEVRIYNRALSADEIKTLAAATHAGADVLPAPDADAKPDAGERLKKLDSLLQQGLINQDEYNKKKKEILDSL